MSNLNEENTNKGTAQFLGIDGVPRVIVGGRAPFSQIINETGRVIFSPSNPGSVRILNDTIPVKVSGTKLSEQLTEKDSVNSTLSFSRVVDTIEFYNTDTENDGIFNANGIDIKVPRGQAFIASIGGTPRSTITVKGSTSYIVTTYI